jgi:hypothetical protein
MSAAFHAAIAALGEVMARENAALREMKLGAAADLAEEKRRAVAALAALRPGQADTPGLRAAIAALEGLTQENRALLERGLAAQGRVIGLIATAVRSARRERSVGGGRYTGAGRHAGAGGQGMAISARI